MPIICIKNMVCRRCILVVTRIFRQHGIEPSCIELGSVRLSRPLPEETASAIRKELEAYGFGWIDDKRTQLIEQIRTAVIRYVHYDDMPDKPKLSDYVSRQCGHDYSMLSKLFAEAYGTSIAKYCIAQKVERAKELLLEGELTVGEIADKLHYSSTAHLSQQFRMVTGLSPSQFKQLKSPRLKSIDEI